MKMKTKEKRKGLQTVPYYMIYVLVYSYTWGGQLLQTHTLMGQEVQFSSPIRMSHQTNYNALID